MPFVIRKGFDARAVPSPSTRITGPCLKWRQLLGHRQVTDAYLLAVAVAEGGRFVSLDQHISVNLVLIAQPEQLVVLEPMEPRLGLRW